MSAANVLRAQIEASLANRIPSALTPAPRTIREVMATGIGPIDEVLDGGLPVGALTEMVGMESSGRTALALSFVAQITRAERVCAWIDISDTLHPESAAATGMDLARLLWVRCGVPSAAQAPPPSQSFALPGSYFVPRPITKGLHGGGFGPHPRGEVKGLSEAVGGLLRSDATLPQRSPNRADGPTLKHAAFHPKGTANRFISSHPLARIEQALRVTDLLLQAGGFSAIVLDMGSLTAEHVSRVPLATWFRYRAAAERTQASVVLLTQHPCAKSSAGLVVRLQAGNALSEQTTVFAGLERRIEVSRQRFMQKPSNVIPLRKPPQSQNVTAWTSKTTWAGCR